jgi:hypothetical protein
MKNKTTERAMAIIQIQPVLTPNGVVLYVLTDDGKVFQSIPGTQQLREMKLEFIREK